MILSSLLALPRLSQFAIAAFGLCAATVLAANKASAQNSAAVAGIWFDSAGEGAIEIAPCGNRMCGRIVWLKKPLNAEGKPLFDRFNPNASLQSRQICGLQVLRDLQPLTDGSWGRGIVYDPKKGAENEASIKPLSATKLQLTGYGLFGLSKSFEWTRAPADLQLCGAIVAKTAPPPNDPSAAKSAATAPAASQAAPGTMSTKPVTQKPAAPKPSSALPAAGAAAGAVKPSSSSASQTGKPASGTSTKPAGVSSAAAKPAAVIKKPAAVATGTPAKPAAAASATAKPKSASTAATAAKPATKPLTPTAATSAKPVTPAKSKAVATVPADAKTTAQKAAAAKPIKIPAKPAVVPPPPANDATDSASTSSSSMPDSASGFAGQQ